MRQDAVVRLDGAITSLEATRRGMMREQVNDAVAPPQISGGVHTKTDEGPAQKLTGIGVFTSGFWEAQMGLRGPSKTPKAILQMRGSWRGDARGDEPQAEKNGPTLRCPGWLADEAKRVWKKVVKQMGVMGVLTLADENLIARYSETWARWRKAHAWVVEKGEGYPVTRDGKIVSVHKYPQTVVASQLLSELTKMEDRMGLSPGSRASLAIEHTGKIANESPEIAKLFNRA